MKGLRNRNYINSFLLLTEQYILKNLFNKVNKTYMQHWYNGANIEISSRKGFPKLKLVNAYELVHYFLFITWEHLNTILIYICSLILEISLFPLKGVMFLSLESYREGKNIWILHEF